MGSEDREQGRRKGLAYSWQWHLPMYGCAGCSLCQGTRLKGKCGWKPTCGWLLQPRLGAAPSCTKAPFSNLCKSTRRTSGSRRVLGRGGIRPDRDRAEGFLGHESCPHKGLDARHEVRREEEGEANSHETVDKTFNTRPQKLSVSWGNLDPQMWLCR